MPAARRPARPTGRRRRSARSSAAVTAGRCGSELLDGGNDAFGHQIQRAQRANPGESAVRYLEAELGQLVQVLDGLLDSFAVLAEVEPDLHGLLDRVVVAAL